MRFEINFFVPFPTEDRSGPRINLNNARWTKLIEKKWILPPRSKMDVDRGWLLITLCCFCPRKKLHYARQSATLDQIQLSCSLILTLCPFFRVGTLLFITFFSLPIIDRHNEWKSHHTSVTIGSCIHLHGFWECPLRWLTSFDWRFFCRFDRRTFTGECERGYQHQCYLDLGMHENL